MKVEVHVEQLVLHGFKPGDRHQIGAGVREELARLLADQGTPQRFNAGVGAAKIEAGSFELNPRIRPKSTGGMIARAIYNGVAR